MQLEQQETFEIKSPQLEVFGQVESKLPAPAKKAAFCGRVPGRDGAGFDVWHWRRAAEKPLPQCG